MLESKKVFFQFVFSECVTCFAFEISDLVQFYSIILQQSFDWGFPIVSQIDSRFRLFCSVIPWVHLRDRSWSQWRLSLPLRMHKLDFSRHGACDGQLGLFTVLPLPVDYLSEAQSTVYLPKRESLDSQHSSSWYKQSRAENKSLYFNFHLTSAAQVVLA